ncbi:MAG: DUF6599 family protein [Pseudomonadota bacterium]
MKPNVRKVSKKETCISILILTALAGIAMGVFFSRVPFHPAVISHQDLAAKEEKSVDDLLPPDREIVMPLPPGMKPLTPPEVFTPDTLYEKINGKAELYLSAGFRELRCRRIHPEQNPELWMEVFIYEMETASNAFSVFSMQRRDSGVPTELSEFSYQTENAVYLATGPHYLEVIGAQAGPEMKQAMLSFLRYFNKDAVSGSDALSEFSRFPEACSDQSRMSVIPSSAFGFDKLDNVYTSRCLMDGKEVMVFLSNRNSPENARKLASAYGTFLTTFGGTEIPLNRTDGDARLIEIFGTYELIFTSGSYLCGVHEAESRETAESMAAILRHRISEVSE